MAPVASDDESSMDATVSTQRYSVVIYWTQACAAVALGVPFASTNGWMLSSLANGRCDSSPDQSQFLNSWHPRCTVPVSHPWRKAAARPRCKHRDCVGVGGNKHKARLCKCKRFPKNLHGTFEVCAKMPSTQTSPVRYKLYKPLRLFGGSTLSITWYTFKHH